MNTVIIIPARYESTRFPGKPLAPIHGCPMIGRVIREKTVNKAAFEWQVEK